MGTFSHHTSCPACGSSDGNAVYEDGGTFCWVCKAVTSPSGTLAPRLRGL
ncbi:MAG: hypothetical protein HC888_01065 [Candidatus Competibacteraceae bacterium]|nr:hypothetical protein [Candidatus Competibacteraceae bacterium]